MKNKSIQMPMKNKDENTHKPNEVSIKNAESIFF